MLIHIVTEPEFAISTWCNDICCGIRNQAKLKRIACRVEQGDFEAREDELVVLVGNSPAWIYNSLNRLQAMCQAHMILISNTPFSQAINNICTNLVQSMQDVLTYLNKDCQKRKIAFYGVNSSSTNDLLKLQGFPQKENVYYSENNLFSCFCHFLEDIEKYDAVICANDYAAISLIQNLKNCAPTECERLFVVSFANTRIAQEYRPSITSVVLDYYEYGRTAVNFYRKLIQNPQISNISIHIKSIIIPRETTRGILCRTEAISPHLDNSEKVDFFKDPEVEKLVALEKLFAIAEDIDYKIIAYLSREYSYEQISQKLFMSVNGVKYRLNRLLAACDIANKTELTKMFDTYFPSMSDNFDLL